MTLAFHVWLFLQGSRMAPAPVVSAGGLLVGQGERLTKQGVQVMGEAAAGCASMAGEVVLVLAWLEMRVLVLPLMGMRAREAEYAADEAAAAAGYGPGLALALEQLAVFELSPMQWHAVLARRHPPIPLRVDRLLPDEPLY